METRVVITGVGPVTSLGVGKQELMTNLFAGQTNICQLPEGYEQNYEFNSKHYVPAPEIASLEFGGQWLSRVMGPAAQISASGAKLALLDAGVTIKEAGKYYRIEGLEDCGVILGIGFSNLEEAFTSYQAHVSSEGENTGKYSRMIIPKMMPNSISSWLSIIYNLSEINYTVNAACASGTYAVGEAYQKIKSGACKAVLSGGVEYLKDDSGAVMRGFDSLNTLTETETGVPMAFGAGRSGFLFNAGAGCILVLEDLESAQKRGSNIHAEIVEYEANSDAHNIVQMEKSGTQIKKLLQELVKDREIDYLNAHGTGTVLNDQVEAKVISEVFGPPEEQPLINSTKGIIGHSIGASGALEAAVTAVSLKEQKVHGNLVQEPLAGLNLAIDTEKADIEYALSTSYGFGGHNAGLVLKRWEER